MGNMTFLEKMDSIDNKSSIAEGLIYSLFEFLFAEQQNPEGDRTTDKGKLENRADVIEERLDRINNGLHRISGYLGVKDPGALEAEYADGVQPEDFIDFAPTDDDCAPLNAQDRKRLDELMEIVSTDEPEPEGREKMQEIAKEVEAMRIKHGWDRTRIEFNPLGVTLHYGKYPTTVCDSTSTPPDYFEKRRTEKMAHEDDSAPMRMNNPFTRD